VLVAGGETVWPVADGAEAAAVARGAPVAGDRTTGCCEEDAAGKVVTGAGVPVHPAVTAAVVAAVTYESTRAHRGLMSEY